VTSIEEMAAWAVRPENIPAGREYAGCDMIRHRFGISRWQAKKASRIARHQSKENHAESGPPPKEGTSYDEAGNQATLIVVSRQISTLDDALKYAEVDLTVWEVERFLVNSWEMGSVDKETGPCVTPLWQVKVWLRRRSPAPVERALEALIEKVHVAKSYPVPKQNGHRMVEVALYDPHFGMLAWAAETGEDYDLNIARHVVGDAAAQIAAQTKGLDLDYYLVVFGNDWMHVNDPTALTPRGQNRLDVDGRLGKITEEAEGGLWDMVDMLAKKAPVKLIWIPGNHDPQTSYWMLRATAQRYRNDGRVEVDTSPKPRRYHEYGVNLIGFLHGCDLPASRWKEMPGIMAAEAAREGKFKGDQYREIHHGHKHTQKELSFVSADTHGGWVIRCIPSLVGTDFWSFQQGYVHDRTAQYFIWHKERGPEGMRSVHVDRSLYRDSKREGSRNE